MNDSSNILRFILVLFLLIANLILQIAFKYSLYEIPITEINFGFLGNIFNILLSSLIIFGAILLYILGDGYDNKTFSTIIFTMIFALSSYLIGYIISNVEFEALNSYILGVPSRKFYLACIFVVNLYIHYYLLSYIWSSILGRQSGGHIKAFSGAILAITLTLGFSYYFISSKDYKIKEQNVTQYFDVAVVLGAAVWSNNKPSPIFEGRIKKTHKLSQLNRIKTVQFTGGSAPGELSEAKVAMEYFNSLGNTGVRVQIEEKTSTTAQQIEFTRNKFFVSNEPVQLVIISDNFHLPRALEMCNFFNIKSVGYASDYNQNLEKLLYYRLRESIALILFWLFGI